MKLFNYSVTLAFFSILPAQATFLGSGGDFLNGISAQQGSGDYLGLDFSRGWFDPAGVHDHSTSGQTGRSRYIHPLTVEAAFNDGDFFLDYAFNSFDDEEEHEIEIEFEFALTRRLGLVLEAAYEFEKEDGSTTDGFADIEIAGRFVLIEFDKFITTANLGFQLPTGDDDFTADELVIEPSLLSWFDLGNGLTLNTSLGLEIGAETGDSSFAFDAALIKDLNGTFAFSIESRNEVGLRRDERGDLESEATLGLIYRFSNSKSIRAGWNFPVSSNNELNSGAVTSFNYSF